MSTLSLFKEYIWLVETIHKARKITLAELNERWLETEMSGGVTISRTTFYKHRCEVEEMFGINIECEKRTNSYYISNEWVLYDNTVQNWLLTTFSVGNLLGDVKDLSLQSRIQLESIPSANEHLELMLEAMKRNRKVRMIYQKYGHATPQEYVLSPYCMKLYMRRWYVLGRKADGQLRVFSFDRMVEVELTEKKFRVEKSFDAQAYFSESYGVMVDERTEAQRIVLRAYGFEPFYLSDLPLHHSQRELQSHTADPASPDDESYTDFELRLRPTGDFKARLLSLGEWIEVMEPQSLADEIAEMHQRAIDRRTRRKNMPLL